MTYLVVTAGLIALVFIHELGHFLVARAVGSRPRSFYVGFPPALVKFERNGVEYGIGAIPLGGLVRIPGMNRPSGRDLESGFAPALEEAPELLTPLRRMSTALDRSDFAAARASVPALRAALEAAELRRFAASSARRALRDADEGSGPDAYWRQATWRRVAIIAAGPAANVLVAFAIFFGVYVTGAPSSVPTAIVHSVTANTPAASAGLHPGDRVIAVNHRPTGTFDAVSTAIMTSSGDPLSLTVRRHGTTVQLPPRRPIREGGRWILGFVPEAHNTSTSYPAGQAASHAAGSCWQVVSGTVSAIVQGLSGNSQNAQVVSVIGIEKVSARALNDSVAQYLEILALVSMSLAFLNLLPLLPLDGGHILFALIERVRGRALAREVYERVSVVGFALIMLLMIFAFSTGNNPQ